MDEDNDGWMLSYQSSTVNKSRLNDAYMAQ